MGSVGVGGGGGAQNVSSMGNSKIQNGKRKYRGTQGRSKIGLEAMSSSRLLCFKVF